MCCLFGIIDYRGELSLKQKNHALSILATQCEVRGADATGIAYNSVGRLCIYKKPLPAHKMRFVLPVDAGVVMGHTRLTTQGGKTYNRNRGTFRRRCGEISFATRLQR